MLHTCCKMSGYCHLYFLMIKKNQLWFKLNEFFLIIFIIVTFKALISIYSKYTLFYNGIQCSRALY